MQVGVLTQIFSLGDTCGSNALNDAFRRLLENLLTDHDYLNEGGATLEGHICKLAIHDFEHYVKPVWVVSQNNQDYHLEVLGLRSDPGSQRPCTNRLTIQAGHLKNIYQHICEEVSMLMMKQLHATAQLGLKTGKVVLVGGFGESAPLRSHLCEALANFNAAHDSNAQLYVADEHERKDRITAVDAVSSGGVLRALNKLYGPTRVAGSSYGTRCDEPFEDSKHAGQLSIQGRQNTQELYVEAIQWLSKKASPCWSRYPTIVPAIAPLYQTFPVRNADGTINHGPFICQDEIWVSDEAYLDHHSYLHEHNKDAQRIGTLKTDVVHLLHPQFLVKNEGAQGPSCDDGRNLYWKFPYELVLTIDGLNMKCVQAFKGEEIGAMRVGIAPGFAPGAN
ncbi:hypothetical protein FPRO06_11253 [Fusarium proliferatum]|nr:hypothetical protein FPRO06_11253 [Fusarium proliferatum]